LYLDDVILERDDYTLLQLGVTAGATIRLEEVEVREMFVERLRTCICSSMRLDLLPDVSAFIISSSLLGG
jgi:RNA-binding protein YlmH